MQSNIVVSVSEFLEALPYQVELWDSGVLTKLEFDNKLFDKFKKANAETKWDIYRDLRFNQ